MTGDRHEASGNRRKAAEIGGTSRSSNEHENLLDSPVSRPEGESREGTPGNDELTGEISAVSFTGNENSGHGIAASGTQELPVRPAEPEVVELSRLAEIIPGFRERSVQKTDGSSYMFILRAPLDPMFLTVLPDDLATVYEPAAGTLPEKIRSKVRLRAGDVLVRARAMQYRAWVVRRVLDTTDVYVSDMYYILRSKQPDRVSPVLLAWAVNAALGNLVGQQDRVEYLSPRLLRSLLVEVGDRAIHDSLEELLVQWDLEKRATAEYLKEKENLVYAVIKEKTGAATPALTKNHENMEVNMLTEREITIKEMWDKYVYGYMRPHRGVPWKFGWPEVSVMAARQILDASLNLEPWEVYDLIAAMLALYQDYRSEGESGLEFFMKGNNAAALEWMANEFDCGQFSGYDLAMEFRILRNLDRFEGDVQDLVRAQLMMLARRLPRLRDLWSEKLGSPDIADVSPAAARAMVETLLRHTSGDGPVLVLGPDRILLAHLILRGVPARVLVFSEEERLSLKRFVKAFGGSGVEIVLNEDHTLFPAADGVRGVLYNRGAVWGIRHEDDPVLSKVLEEVTPEEVFGTVDELLVVVKAFTGRRMPVVVSGGGDELVVNSAVFTEGTPSLLVDFRDAGYLDMKEEWFSTYITGMALFVPGGAQKVGTAVLSRHLDEDEVADILDSLESGDSEGGAVQFHPVASVRDDRRVYLHPVTFAETSWEEDYREELREMFAQIHAFADRVREAEKIMLEALVPEVNREY